MHGQQTTDPYVDLNPDGKINLLDPVRLVRIPASPTPTPALILPNEYSTITGCSPFLGNNDAPLKILFVNLGNAPYFNELVDDVINQEIKVISPFKEYFNFMAFYSLTIDKTAEMNCGLGSGQLHSGFACDNDLIYTKIKQQCLVDDLGGIITIAYVETTAGGSGGDIIYIGSSSTRSLDVQRALNKNVAIHEIAHNFGLADLYYGTYNYDGQPSQFWPTEFSRSFMNVDGPGCEKWCSDYKPVAEYTESVSSQCLNFDDKNSCVTFGRDSSKRCQFTGDFPNCCVWSDSKFEYFNSNCVPAFGSENIGIGCYQNSGCYYGAVYGNYAWRPVLNREDSIMFSLSASEFDDVSESELNKVWECCLTPTSMEGTCTTYRQQYADFLQNINFKKRIGSCGYQTRN